MDIEWHPWNAQAGLHLCCSQTHENRLSPVEAHCVTQCSVPIFLTIGYITHSFFIHLGIANVNWVVNISNKYLIWVFWFSIGYFCKC